MDLVDQSFETEEQHRAESLNVFNQVKPMKLQPVGYCLHCYEDVERDKLFCDKICADGYHKDRLIRGQLV